MKVSKECLATAAVWLKGISFIIVQMVRCVNYERCKVHFGYMMHISSDNGVVYLSWKGVLAQQRACTCDYWAWFWFKALVVCVRMHRLPGREAVGRWGWGGCSSCFWRRRVLRVFALGNNSGSGANSCPQREEQALHTCHLHWGLTQSRGGSPGPWWRG